MPMMAKTSKNTKQQNATARDMENTFQVFTLNWAKHRGPTKLATTKAVKKPGAWIGGDYSHKSYKKLNIEKPP